jgi:hypothetical protein
MTIGPMRRLFSSSSRAQLFPRFASTHLAAPRLLGLKQYQRNITGVRPRQASVTRTWFTSSSAWLYPGGGDNPPPNERNLKLGESIHSLSFTSRKQMLM